MSSKIFLRKETVKCVKSVPMLQTYTTVVNGCYSETMSRVFNPNPFSSAVLPRVPAQHFPPEVGSRVLRRAPEGTTNCRPLNTPPPPLQTSLWLSHDTFQKLSKHFLQSTLSPSLSPSSFPKQQEKKKKLKNKTIINIW